MSTDPTKQTTIEAGQVWMPEAIGHANAGPSPKIILRVGPRGGVYAARLPRRGQAISFYTHSMLLDWIAKNNAHLVLTAPELVNE
jgi:hypothetical protein